MGEKKKRIYRLINKQITELFCQNKYLSFGEWDLLICFYITRRRCKLVYQFPQPPHLLKESVLARRTVQ